MNRPSSIETRLFINNEFVESDTKLHIKTPFDDTLVATVSSATPEHVNQAVCAALEAQPAWDGISPSGRKPLLFNLARLLRAHQHELSLLEALNLGRPLPDTIGEIHFVSNMLEYFADAAQDVTGETRSVDGMLGLEIRQPFGVVAAILPWNVPISMFAWKVGAAVATGNTVVVKSSEKAPLSCLKLAALVREAGFPPGVVNVLSGGPDCGEILAAHHDVRRLTFTGSTATGRKLMETAAKTNLKTLSMELGGKSACLVFADTDIKAAAEKAAFSIGWLAGQTCFANSRILVQEEVAEEFLKLFTQVFSQGFGYDTQTIMQDPTIEGAKGISPVVDAVQLRKVLSYIENGKKHVAPIIGGYRIGEKRLFKGWFVAHTIFSGLPRSSELLKEEIFGPVVCLNTFSTEAEAIEMSNDTEYGLFSSVFTDDISRAVRVAKALHAGMVTINSTSPDMCPGMSFGGWKLSSGSGARDGFKAGLDSMLQKKAVSIRFPATSRMS